jgi:hypothetical protein
LHLNLADSSFVSNPLSWANSMKRVSDKAVVLTYPPMPGRLSGENSVQIPLGGRQQELYDDPEVQGGRIALTASNNNKVQKPPNFLDRTHASLPRQVAYNQRVLSAENEIAGINCDIGESLSQMSLVPAEPVVICVNSGESLKRHEQHLGGQLWLQSDRQMTATNIQFEGMSDDATSVCLAEVAEAVEWAHILETGLPKSTTQRGVIYPPSLSKLETILVTGNIGSDTENGHDIAYERILSACSKYENPPAFFPAGSQDFDGLDIADKIQLWMHTAAQVSIGGRSQVLENGPDTFNSQRDSENEDHGEVLSGMYTPDIPLDSHGCPIDARHKLSDAQVSALRAQAGQLLRSTTQASAAGPNEPTTHSPPKEKLASTVDDQVGPVKKAVTKELPKRDHHMTTP